MADKKKSEKKLHVMSVSKSLPDELNQLQLSDDDVQCPKSNLLPISPNDIPDEFYCENCV